jgi:membrane protease YdiL (CAAX protease family)
MAILAYYVVFSLVNMGLNAVAWLAGGRAEPWSDYIAAAVRFATPFGMWAAHLALAALVLVAWAAYRFVHHRRLAWLWSVMPGVRWRYALACSIIAVVVFGAMAWYVAESGPGWDPAPDWGWFLLAVVVSSPLQALGEEVLFRGYLLQAFGLIWRRPWFPIVASAALFGAFHGSQNIWLFLSRFAFGLLAGALVWKTGGLEAGVAAHVANNIAAFGLAIGTGTLQATRELTVVSPLESLRDVGLFALFAAAAWGVATLMRVPNKVPGER